ncbi:hypothetical protein [Comamonas terrigena]|uniref:hypothetical protein n=1 Tax=Comamonas terrigena TaxID=32013 RepID=UPI00289E2F7B|nr:hypothetical protein [Comamonas terrigena]
MPALKTEAKTSFASTAIRTPTKQFTRPDGTEVTVHAIPVLPASPFHTFVDDARHEIEYSYDAAEVIAAFDPARPLPLDVEHATETGATDTRSRGWGYALVTADHAPELALEPGVLYGLFELNDLGLEALTGKHFGYTSAVSLGAEVSETAFRITSVKSNALTNNPATEMPVAFTRATSSGARNDSYTQCPNNFSATEMEEILALLGLPADLPADTQLASILAEIQALLDAKAASVAASATDSTAMSAITALTERVTALDAAVQGIQDKSAAFSASLTRQVTPAKVPTDAEKAGVSAAAFARTQQILAARGRTL